MTHLRLRPRDTGEQARLDIAAPCLVAVMALVLSIGAGTVAATRISVDATLEVKAAVVSEANVLPVTHARGGRIAAVKVAEGQRVAAGDELLSFETDALQQQIAVLRSEAESMAGALERARLQASTMADLVHRNLASPDKVAALEKEATAVAAEAANLDARIAAAGRELERAVVRAPVAGRIRGLRAAAPGASVASDVALLEIVPDGEPLAIEGRITAAEARGLKPGARARILIEASDTSNAVMMSGRLEWISEAQAPVSTALGRDGDGVAVRIALDPAGEAHALPQAGAAARVRILTGSRTLWDEVMLPFTTLRI